MRPPRNWPACAFALSAQCLCYSLCIPSEFSEFLLVIPLMTFINQEWMSLDILRILYQNMWLLLMLTTLKCFILKVIFVQRGYPLWKKWACGKVCCRAMTKLSQWCGNIAARLLQCVFTMQMKSAIRLPQTYCKIAANIWLYYGKWDFTKLKIRMHRPSGMLLF